MVEKYIYKSDYKIGEHYKTVHYGKNKSLSKQILVKAYKRKQRFINPEYMAIQFGKKHGIEFSGSGKYKDLLANQVLHQDWSHMSEQYPNIIGLTDIEINQFLSNPNNWNEHLYSKRDVDYVKHYLQHIKCYSQYDIERISSNMYDSFDKRMTDWYEKEHQKQYNTPIEPEYKHNKYSKNTTIYVTSPKGGHEILAIFSYANSNDIKKRNIPYDWSTNSMYGEKTLKTESLPYSYEHINDVNDIVYIDDIFMSGEQFSNAKKTILFKLKELEISEKQLPRLHYMAIAGNMDQQINAENIELAKKHLTGKDWHTITIGDKLSFDGGKYPHTKACVFPYSIPDGDHHKIARILYNKYHKFTHRSVG